MRAQGLDARDLRLEQAALGVDHVELARDAVLVAQARKAQRLVERGGARRLGVVALARAPLRDQRGPHLAERGANRLLILRQRRALARIGGVAPRRQAAASEDRL